MRTEIKNIEIKEKGTYKVDRINDVLGLCDQEQHRVLDANDIQTALELFAKDDEAYCLRFVQEGLHHDVHKGRLIAHKSTPFPECLSIAASILRWANGITRPTELENDERVHLNSLEVDSVIASFNEYYLYHPQLHTKWREIVLLHLRLLRASTTDINTVEKRPNTDLLRATCWHVLNEHIEHPIGDWFLDSGDGFQSDTPRVDEELIPKLVYKLHQDRFGDTGLLDLTDVSDREAQAQHNSQKQP